MKDLFHYFQLNNISVITLNMVKQRSNECSLNHDANLESNCNCLIECLLKRSFSGLPFNEKEIIINSPKPTPQLNIQSKTKTFKRHFKSEVYEQIKWICGCVHLSKLFCWPCLLFSQFRRFGKENCIENFLSAQFNANFKLYNKEVTKIFFSRRFRK